MTIETITIPNNITNVSDTITHTSQINLDAGSYLFVSSVIIEQVNLTISPFYYTVVSTSITTLNSEINPAISTTYWSVPSGTISNYTSKLNYVLSLKSQHTITWSFTATSNSNTENSFQVNAGILCYYYKLPNNLLYSYPITSNITLPTSENNINLGMFPTGLYMIIFNLVIEQSNNTVETINSLIINNVIHTLVNNIYSINVSPNFYNTTFTNQLVFLTYLSDNTEVITNLQNISSTGVATLQSNQNGSFIQIVPMKLQLTNYKNSEGKDLIDIFYPLAFGGTPQVTGTDFFYNTGSSQTPVYKDLTNLFASFEGTNPAPVTYYVSDSYNKDLNKIFKNINEPPSI